MQLQKNLSIATIDGNFTKRSHKTGSSYTEVMIFDICICGRKNMETAKHI